MFSRAAKSVVKNFGRRNYHAGKNSLKNTQALVLAAERSRLPGIRTPLVEQTAEKPVLNSATTSEQNGLVTFPTEENSLNEKTQHSVRNEDMTLISGSVSGKAQETPNTCESSLAQGSELPEFEAGELQGIIHQLTVREEPNIDANRQLRSYPVSNFSQHLGISKQLKTPGAEMCSQYQDITYTPKIQNGQLKMSCITGELNYDDCLFVRNKKVPCHPPGDQPTSPGQPANPLRRKKEKKRLCVKCPTKKPSEFFTSMAYGEGTETAEPGSDFFSSTTQPSESTIFGGGFERRRESGRSTEANLNRSLLSVLVPGCNIPRRCYGKCGNGPKSPKSPSQPSCPEPKKTPVCPSPCTPPVKPCPPSKVKFRECPPPPKLPKLPKCPPPCAPPPPPPVPKCPDIPKCPPPCAPPKDSPKCPTSPACLPPKKKCSGRQMSTYGLIQRDCKYASRNGIVLRERCPVFLVACRRFSSSSANFASKSKSDKNCDSNDSKSSKKGKETGKDCTPKKSATDRCAKSKSKKRDAKGARDCRRSKAVEKCPAGCAPKPRCPEPLPPPPPKPQVEWFPPICSTPKLVRPSPCPELSKQLEPGNPAPSKPKCPPPPPLPKPPCRPVCLCPCPPPPKLPPGSCPDIPSVEQRTEPSCPPPCPPKPLPPCPEDTWCPSKPICPSKK